MPTRGGNAGQDTWLAVVKVVLVAVTVVTVTGTGGHATNVAPGNPAICVTMKLPQLPQS
jgi:hypothetical protein